MSAFVVNMEHIAAMVHAGLTYRRYGEIQWSVPDQTSRSTGLTEDTATETGRMLVRQNVRSVNHRYRDNDDPDELAAEFEYKPSTARNMTPVEVLKLIACYEYQACESPDWRRTEAHEFCQALRNRLIGFLPGYDAAPWGL